MFIRSVALTQNGFRGAVWALVLSLVSSCSTGCAVVNDDLQAGTRYGAPLDSDPPSVDPLAPDESPPIPPEPPEPPSSKPEPYRGRLVHVYAPDWCVVCKTIPNHPRYVKHKEPFPAWVYERQGWPVLHWQRKDGSWYATVGWTDEETLLKRMDKWDDPKPPVRKGYPIRGAWWTHPGDVWSHLINDHGFHPDFVRTLSRAEAESLHTDDHTGRVQGNPPKFGRAGRGFRSSARQAFCPTGYS